MMRRFLLLARPVFALVFAGATPRASPGAPPIATPATPTYEAAVPGPIDLTNDLPRREVVRAFLGRGVSSQQCFAPGSEMMSRWSVREGGEWASFQ